MGCGRANTYLCPACFNKIEISSNNACFFCGRPAWQGKICEHCSKQSGLNKFIAAAEYKNPLIQNLIKNFKYNFIKELSQPLSRLSIKSLENNLKLEIENRKSIVVPVPLYKYRLCWRGFNQAELLAKEISDYFYLPLETNVLMGEKDTLRLSADKRPKNAKKTIKGAFEISKKFAKRCLAENNNLLREKTVILVDDVATSGATLSEAAKVLKKAGAKEVWGVVVAKG